MTAPVRLRTKKLKKFKKAQMRRRGSRMIMTAPLRLPFKVYSVASAVDRKLPFKLSWIKKAQKSEQHEAEAEKSRIQVQKEAEGCLKQM